MHSSRTSPPDGGAHEKRMLSPRWAVAAPAMQAPACAASGIAQRKEFQNKERQL